MTFYFYLLIMILRCQFNNFTKPSDKRKKIRFISTKKYTPIKLFNKITLRFFQFRINKAGKGLIK